VSCNSDRLLGEIGNVAFASSTSFGRLVGCAVMAAVSLVAGSAYAQDIMGGPKERDLPYDR